MPALHSAVHRIDRAVTHGVLDLSGRKLPDLQGNALRYVTGAEGLEPVPYQYREIPLHP